MPHEITDKCAAVHCDTHQEDEPSAIGGYRACYGCNHVYVTPEDLGAAYVEQATKIDPAVAKVSPPVGKIPFCPFCLTDW